MYKSHCAEDFYLKLLESPDGSITDVFIDVQHGRLHHMVGALIKLFVLFKRIGVKPHLYSASENAFKYSNFMIDAINSSLLEEKQKYAHIPILNSEFIRHFSNDFMRLWEDIGAHGQEIEEAINELGNYFKPVARIFAEKSFAENIATKVGMNYENFVNKRIVSLHLRRGDLAVLDRQKYQNTPLAQWFKDDYFCLKRDGWGFVGSSAFLLGTYHSAKRIGNQKSIPTYDEILKEHTDENDMIFVFSDGFIWSARQFKIHSGCDLPIKGIIRIINNVEFSFSRKKHFISAIGSEMEGCNNAFDLGFDDLLYIAHRANVLICRESMFPLSFLRLLWSGNSAKNLDTLITKDDY